MKHFVKLAVVLSLVAIALAACTGVPEATDTASLSSSSSAGGTSGTSDSTEFADVANRDWLLVELRIGSRRVAINRDKLAAEGFGEFFTLRFAYERIMVNGVGAPNRYFGPYTLAENQAITMGPVASTQMAALREPEELKEHEYYNYLNNIYRWNLTGGNLELQTRADGTEAVLVFAQAR